MPKNQKKVDFKIFLTINLAADVFLTMRFAMFEAFAVVQIVICILLVIIILLQEGKKGMGAIFGGSSSSVFGARGAGNILTKITSVLAILFMLNSVWMSYISSSDKSVVKIEKQAEKAPAAAAQPAEEKKPEAVEQKPAEEPKEEAPAAEEQKPAEEQAPAAEEQKNDQNEEDSAAQEQKDVPAEASEN